jgi:hypothetical protein
MIVKKKKGKEKKNRKGKKKASHVADARKLAPLVSVVREELLIKPEDSIGILLDVQGNAFKST